MFSKLFLCSFLITALGSCTSGKITKVSLQPQLKSVLTVYDFSPKSETDYTVNNWSIKDSILIVNISYQGGCDGFHFDLINDGTMQKSLPPKTTVYLVHQSEKETCKLNQTHDFKFNLTPLKKMNRTGSVMVKLAGQEAYLELKSR